MARASNWDRSMGNVDDSGYRTVDESSGNDACASGDVNKLIKDDLLERLPLFMERSKSEVQRDKENAWKENLKRIKESRDESEGKAVWTGKSVRDSSRSHGHSSSRSRTKASVLVKSGLSGLMNNRSVDVVKIYPVETKPKMMCWTCVDSNILLPDKSESELDVSLEDPALLDSLAPEELSIDNDVLANVINSGFDSEENVKAVNALKCDQVFLNVCDRMLEHEKREWEKIRMGDWKYSNTCLFHVLHEYCGVMTFPYEIRSRYERLKKPEFEATELDLPKVPSVANWTDVMQNCHKYFCRRCYVYNCMVHATPEKVRLEEQDYQKGKSKAILLRPPMCSPECYKPHYDEFKVEWIDEKIADEWIEEEKSVFLAAGQILRNDFCKLAEVIGSKTCFQIFQFWSLVTSRGGDFDGKGATPLRKKRLKNKESCHKFSNYCRTNGLLLGLEDAQKPHADTYPAYRPCYHPGHPCIEKYCGCIYSGLVCEKYCGCSINDFQCRNLFPGCSCKGACKKSCECVIAARECDVDMCRCASEGWRKQGPKDIQDNPCINTTLQKKIGAKVRLAESRVAGWGLFADEDIKEGDFIGEYVGELISSKETVRREKAYARIGYTYLFSKDRDHTVDGMRFGNNIRFVNSAPDAETNCNPCYRTVYGDLRIALYARKNIAKGDELFFDYESALQKQAEDQEADLNKSKDTFPKKCANVAPRLPDTIEKVFVARKQTAMKTASPFKPAKRCTRADTEDETDSSS